MATYSSYKKITTDDLADSAINSTALAHGARTKPTQQWIYNERGMACHNCQQGCCEQANGKCCLWTVPAKVTRVTFELWSGGGGGPGQTCCNCCSFAIGGMGGSYAVRTITTAPGCQYSVCAAGTWPCHWSHTCEAAGGCVSYVNGFNLSNFCVQGGCGGWMCNGDAWGRREMGSGCATCNICSSFGSDFGISGTGGHKIGHMGCHCSGADGSFTGTAPFIGKMMGIQATEVWCSCGCYTNWPAGGGLPGVSSYCDNFAKQCAAGMGMGGSGVVRITYA